MLRPEVRDEPAQAQALSNLGDSREADNPELRPELFVAVVVPEPSQLILLAAGALGLLAFGAWRRFRIGTRRE
jgi:hypothetical protein